MSIQGGGAGSTTFGGHQFAAPMAKASPSYRSINLATPSRDYKVSPFKVSNLKQSGRASVSKVTGQEILHITELLDLPYECFATNSMQVSALASRFGTPYGSVNVTPNKQDYPSEGGVRPPQGFSSIPEQRPRGESDHLGKRGVKEVGFEDIVAGVRKKLIQWKDLEFSKESLKFLDKNYGLLF